MLQTITQLVKKQVIVLMIPKGEGQHYSPVKKIVCIINRTNCLNSLHALATKNKLELEKKIC